MIQFVMAVFPVPANPFSKKSFSEAFSLRRYSLMSFKATDCDGVGVWAKEVVSDWNKDSCDIIDRKFEYKNTKNLKIIF